MVENFRTKEYKFNAELDWLNGKKKKKKKIKVKMSLKFISSY